MSKPLELTGQRFGHLVAIRRLEKRTHGFFWECRCDCGKLHEVIGRNLKSGAVTQCAECGHKQRAAAKVTHDASYSGEYSIWNSMIQRCHNPKNARYDSYGGRGITVCKRWRIFDNFLADMSPRPAGTSIDRIDNDKGYEPGNCRWATGVEQGNNKRTNRLVTVDGVTRTKAEWMRLCGVSHSAFYKPRNGETTESLIRKAMEKLS